MGGRTAPAAATNLDDGPCDAELQQQEHLYKLIASGDIYCCGGAGSSWTFVKNIGGQVKDATAFNQNMLYITGDGSYITGISMDSSDDPTLSYGDLQKAFEDEKARTAAQEAEVTRLKGVKEADDKVIAQLQTDFRGAEGQVATLTAKLQDAKPGSQDRDILLDILRKQLSGNDRNHKS